MKRFEKKNCFEPEGFNYRNVFTNIMNNLLIGISRLMNLAVYGLITWYIIERTKHHSGRNILIGIGAVEFIQLILFTIFLIRLFEFIYAYNKDKFKDYSLVKEKIYEEFRGVWELKWFKFILKYPSLFAYDEVVSFLSKKRNMIILLIPFGFGMLYWYINLRKIYQQKLKTSLYFSSNDFILGADGLVETALSIISIVASVPIKIKVPKQKQKHS